ncbi:MAG: alpha-galactosidase [Planctomycetota bacterium]|nr:alpha-galactosidase [Planctomycetota bacterium]
MKSNLLVASHAFAVFVALTCPPSPAQGARDQAVEVELHSEPAPPTGATGPDWLLDGADYGAGLWFHSPDPTAPAGSLAAAGARSLDNGLVRRTWLAGDSGACVELQNLTTGETLLRAVQPEARLLLDGEEVRLGGLVGQPNRAFLLDEWLEDGTLAADPGAWVVKRTADDRIEERAPRTPWKRVRHHAPDVVWPPQGAYYAVTFVPPAGTAAAERFRGVEVTVHYELYDGLPLFSKWLTLDNAGERAIELDRVTVEELSIVEGSNWVETRGSLRQPAPAGLHVETDYAFGGFVPENAMRQTVHWRPEPEFTSQVNYRLETPCRLVVEPTYGPDVILQPGGSFESMRAFELLMDSTDRERRGLARRRMLRTIAPWVTENPLMLHVVSTDPDTVRTAIDQAADCGFELVSLSFGSGLNMEDTSAANHAKFRQLASYAADRGVALGGYSLLASRRIQPDSDNAINKETGEPGGSTFGFAPALASDWGQAYFAALRAFFEETGFLQFTHDGSYPGDTDAAARPPLQRGFDDSQWVQWNVIRDFYHFLRERGVYLRVPDYYYLSGANECGMGYREVNWSLPRAQQVIHTRQNIYDGTWTKTPSMGWMFVPLTQYHGGGAAATIEPLDQHRDHYERMLQSNLALGVQAVYRGFRLFDTEATRAVVKRNVDWYKAHRDILESDVVHGRRADGRGLDWMLHVNPALDECGMLVVFNPLDHEVTKTLRVPLYYTGLDRMAMVRSADGPLPLELAYVQDFDIEISSAASTQDPIVEWGWPIARDYTLDLPVTVPAGGMAWYSFSKP